MAPGLQEGDTHKYVHKQSLVQAIESCPSSDVPPPAVLPTLAPFLMKIQSQLA